MIKIGNVRDIAIPDVATDSVFIDRTREIMRPQVQELRETNNIKEVIDNLDRDVVDEKTNLTSIDFNTRLTSSELGSIVALQMLHTLQVGGSSCSLISRSIKRHKVSLGGLGRTEKVKIIQGEREHETQNRDSSLFGKLKGFMGGNNEQK